MCKLFTNVLAKKYPIVRAVESFDLESSTSNLKKWQSIIWLDEQSKPNYIKFIQPFFFKSFCIRESRLSFPLFC